MTEPKRVLPEHLARLMSPEDRKIYGIKLRDEIINEQEIGLEKELHVEFMAFLHRHRLGYYHAAMHKKSELGAGVPDFGVYRGSRIIWVEFKAGKNKLSEEQKNRIAKMLTDGNEIRVCYDYKSAIKAVTEFFRITE